MSRIRLILGELGYTGLFGLLLFVPAGTLNWPKAWILLSVLLIVRTLGALSVLQVNPDLLVERSKVPLHRGQPWLDKILLPGIMAAFAGLVAFNAIDRFHLHLMTSPGSVLSAVGLVAFGTGWILVAVALRTNAFATTVVRHQTDRAQRVVDTGVYSLVRHPMYTGLLPVMFGMGLWLGSYAGTIFALIPTCILVARIVLEERVLRTALPGYAEYAERVRSRLIPYVW